MRSIESEIDVDAPSSVVWEVLTDGESYPEWNPFVRRLEGELRPERRVTVRIDPPGGRAMTFRPRVKVVDPERRLAWKGSLGIPGLFDGRHEFRIEPREEGGIRFVQRETFGGLFVPLLLQERRVRQGFEESNQALKERAETRASGEDRSRRSL